MNTKRNPPMEEPSMKNPSVITDRVLQEVLAERIAQDDKFGEQNHPDGTGGGHLLHTAATLAHSNLQRAVEKGSATWYLMLRDETMQAAIERNPAKLRAHLIRVAADAVAWAEAIDRRAGGAS
jgi:hypothetical protein